MPLVFFEFVHYAAATERITPMINASSGGSGIFEAVSVVPGMEFRRTDAAIGMALHPVGERFEPVRSDFDVGIHQDKQLRINPGKSPVVASGETVVLVELYPTDGREFALHHCH